VRPPSIFRPTLSHPWLPGSQAHVRLGPVAFSHEAPRRLTHPTPKKSVTCRTAAKRPWLTLRAATVSPREGHPIYEAVEFAATRARLLARPHSLMRSRAAHGSPAMTVRRGSYRRPSDRAYHRAGVARLWRRSERAASIPRSRPHRPGVGTQCGGRLGVESFAFSMLGRTRPGPLYIGFIGPGK
jgi:hypothetical protein